MQHYPEALSGRDLLRCHAAGDHRALPRRERKGLASGVWAGVLRARLER
jgi:hypothetical protein